MFFTDLVYAVRPNGTKDQISRDASSTFKVRIEGAYPEQLLSAVRWDAHVPTLPVPQPLNFGYNKLDKYPANGVHALHKSEFSDSKSALKNTD